MVRQHDWYDPSVLRRIRRTLTIATWLVIVLIIFIWHDAILYLSGYLFQ